MVSISNKFNANDLIKERNKIAKKIYKMIDANSEDLYQITKSGFIRCCRKRAKTWEELCVTINPITNEFTNLGQITYLSWATSAIMLMIRYGKTMDEILSDIKE